MAGALRDAGSRVHAAPDSVGLCALGRWILPRRPEAELLRLAPGPAAQEEAVIVLNLEPEALLTFNITPRDVQNC